MEHRTSSLTAHKTGSRPAKIVGAKVVIQLPGDIGALRYEAFSLARRPGRLPTTIMHHGKLLSKVRPDVVEHCIPFRGTASPSECAAVGFMSVWALHVRPSFLTHVAYLSTGPSTPIPSLLVVGLHSVEPVKRSRSEEAGGTARSLRS